MAHAEGPLLILAGAGSGKTRVLTERTSALIRRGVPAPEILNITFTRKAAGELSARVRAATGADGLRALTFHAFGASICRREYARFGRDANFAIRDAEEAEAEFALALEQTGQRLKKGEQRAWLTLLDRLKNDGWRSRDSDAGAGLARLQRLARSLDVPEANLDAFMSAFARYEDLLQRHNACDFSDLLLYPLEVFREHPEVLRDYQERYPWLQVDEYQDTNRVQYHLVNLLAQRTRNLAVVGDDGQAIYGWRGADVGNILSFQKDYPDAVVVKLEDNYRSGSAILEVANTLIAHNRKQIPKVMRATRPVTGEAAVLAFPDAESEAGMVAAEVRDLGRSLPWDEIAVLYRTNTISRLIERELSTQRVPYQIIGGLRFWARGPVRDGMAYLGWIHNPADRLAFERIMDKPRRNIHGVTFAKLMAAEEASGRPFAEILGDPSALGVTKGRQESLRGMRALLDGYRERVVAGGPGLGAVLREMLEGCGYLRWLSEQEEAADALANVEELCAAASAAGSVERLFEEARLSAPQDDSTQGAVSLMTVHAAKGLEFGTVFVIGMEEGSFPHSKAEDTAEERRLAYVAFTRAKDRLLVSYSSEGRGWNRWSGDGGGPSRFVREAGLRPRRSVAAGRRRATGQGRAAGGRPGRAARG